MSQRKDEGEMPNRGSFSFRRRLARCWHAAGPMLILLVHTAAAGQEPPPPQSSRPEQPNEPDMLRFRVPTITVTAEKTPDNVQDVPASVTGVSQATLDSEAARTVSDVAIYAPNTFFTEFSARKLSNARIRGIGASPNNPGVTTYIDGVPQLNANSSSIELIDVRQVEFVRGPQSALYGRNTLGGLISVVSAEPSRTKWSGSLVGPYGNYNGGDVRATASGPLAHDTLSAGLAFGYAGRDGFTRNDATGHDLDSRSAIFGKGQLLWTPTTAWRARLILTGERARDGDYALMDLAALRANPFHAARDFEGFTTRDVVAPTVLVSHTGGTLEISTITGFEWWKTEDLTDLDYTVQPLITRRNNERDFQFTEEVRVAPVKGSSVALSDRVGLKWQAGLFVFSQSYAQDAVNNFAPFVLSQFLGFAVNQHSPQSMLDDRGVGVYGQGTFTIGRKLDAMVSLRGDQEHKEAALNTFYSPPITAAAAVNATRHFSDVSPQFTGAYRFATGKMTYATIARGFKAGGFNSASPAGREAYGEEHSWNYEIGLKTSWWQDRVAIDGSAFVIDWRNMQTNVPNPAVPAQYYIANVGGARSRGAELEIIARPVPSLDLFGTFGYTNARFSSGSQSSGVAVGGKRLSNTPDFTTSVGGQYSRTHGTAMLYGRAEVALTGSYEYDDTNTVGQAAYALANFRAGARVGRTFVEGWVRNAFNAVYVPVAFAYPGLASSGFIGEMGPPRTYGIRAGVSF
jgi:iron complex outermembrane receptor protein